MESSRTPRQSTCSLTNTSLLVAPGISRRTMRDTGSLLHRSALVDYSPRDCGGPTRSQLGGVRYLTENPRCEGQATFPSNSDVPYPPHRGLPARRLSIDRPSHVCGGLLANKHSCLWRPISYAARCRQPHADNNRCVCIPHPFAGLRRPLGADSPDRPTVPVATPRA